MSRYTSSQLTEHLFFKHKRNRLRSIILREERTALAKNVRLASMMGLFGVCMLLLLTACGPLSANAGGSANSTAVWVRPQATSWPAWMPTVSKQVFRSHGQYLAAEALSLAHSLYGTGNNSYYADDPMLADALAYWKRTCQKADGSLCDEAKSGNLQCVEFLSGVFASIDDELPAIGDANHFWDLYRGQSGWQEIPASAVDTSAPQLGDMVAWKGGSAGHLALVVDVQPPVHGKDGSLTVVESNAKDLLEKLTWHANGQIDSWSGYTLQGFIRQQEIAPCLQQHVSNEQQQWETLAIQAAVYFGMPSRYFLQQLCQSDFQAHAVSSSGAQGIAQLSRSVAAQVPRCMINFINNALNCDQRPGSLPAGNGIDPEKPEEAIPAAAYTMSNLYSHYLKQSPHDTIKAYQMALAAYHGGVVPIDRAVSACGSQRWLSCLDSQHRQDARNYIHAILGVIVA